MHGVWCLLSFKFLGMCQKRVSVIGGLESWTGVLDWSTGLEHWTGVEYWSALLIGSEDEGY